MDLHLSDIGKAIELAIAPVFLLAGVGTLLLVLTGRLGRLIDRTWALDERLKADPGNPCMGELLSLHQRVHLINICITASTACGLLVCMVIAMLFVGESVGLSLDQYIALCFIAGMLALTIAFGCFIREIVICCVHLRAQQMRALRHCGVTPG